MLRLLPDLRPVPSAAFALIALTCFAVAQSAFPNRPAPELTVDAWLNVAPGEQPTIGGLRGRTVLVEFWGTSTKQVMRSIPHAQAFHDRYAALGLTVLAVCTDRPETIRRDIERRGYSIPIASDSGSASFRTYNIGEAPIACLIGPDGRILYIGRPEAAELEIERALGIDLSPAALLTAYLARDAASDEDGARRASLEQLIAKKPRAFDLGGWALHRAMPPGADRRELSAAVHGSDWPAVLTSLVQAVWSGDEAAYERHLGSLAAAAPRFFDLLAWARGELARTAPLELEELEDLLGRGRHELAFEALLYRSPKREHFQRALADEGFVLHCGHVTPEARNLARKALLAQHWVFPGVEPRSRQRLWTELGVASAGATDGTAPGLTIGTERVAPDTIASFVDEQILRFLAASSLASHRPPTGLSTRLAAERTRLLDDLKSRHGARSQADH